MIPDNIVRMASDQAAENLLLEFKNSPDFESIDKAILICQKFVVEFFDEVEKHSGTKSKTWNDERWD